MASFARANVVFLTIDSATVSGVAISVPEADAHGRLTGYCEVSTGEARTQKHRAAFVADALKQAKDCDVPLVVIGEEWTHHGLSAAAYASLCENWGKWLAAIETANAKCHIVRVNPNTWRAAVFGKHKPSTRDGLKTFAVRYVHQTLDQPLNLSDNIAEALCIRVWGERAAEVHALLQKKAKRGSKNAQGLVDDQRRADVPAHRAEVLKRLAPQTEKSLQTHRGCHREQVAEETKKPGRLRV